MHSPISTAAQHFFRSNSAPSPQLLEAPRTPSPQPSPQPDDMLTLSVSQPAVWGRLFEALVDIITHDGRRRCADLAAEVLFSFAEGPTSSEWDMETWQAFLVHAVTGIFDVREVWMSKNLAYRAG